MLVEILDQRARRHTAPRVGDQLFDFVRLDGREPNQDRGIAVVVIFGEELLVVDGEQRLFLGFVGDANGDDGRIGNARLLRLEALEPDPDDPFSLPRSKTENAKRSFDSTVSGSDNGIRRTSS